MTILDTLNHADRMARYWRAGTLAWSVFTAALVELGFYGIVRSDDGVVAYLNGVRFELSGETA